jgi:hypothetical protein
MAKRRKKHSAAKAKTGLVRVKGYVRKRPH